MSHDIYWALCVEDCAHCPYPDCRRPGLKIHDEVPEYLGNRIYRRDGIDKSAKKAVVTTVPAIW